MLATTVDGPRTGISVHRARSEHRSHHCMGVAEVRRPKVLEEENHKLKQLVADLSLDKQMLQDVLREKA